jgi:ketosteroid isomerase-like protein
MFENETAELMRRFNDAFRFHQPEALRELVAEDCVIENTSPAPEGSRAVGREACLSVWQGLAAARDTQFELEEVLVASERAVIRWRFRFGPGPADWNRGVNLMRVRGGQIVEAMGYVKGP